MLTYLDPREITSTPKPTLRWRDLLSTHPAAELSPPMSPDELRELGEDILENGLTSPIVLWREHPEATLQLLDGRNRLDAIEIATGFRAEVDAEGDGWIIDAGTWYSDKVIVLNNTVDPDVYIISANIRRRHLNLTAKQKRELIAKLIKAKPESSNNAIAKQVKADDKTVAKVRRELEGRSEIPTVATRTDTKGRNQPAKKQPAKRQIEHATQPAPTEADLEAWSAGDISRNEAARRGTLVEASAEIIRDDIGPSSELARLQARVAELQDEKHRLQMENLALRSELEELKLELTQRTRVDDRRMQTNRTLERIEAQGE